MSKKNKITTPPSKLDAFVFGPEGKEEKPFFTYVGVPGDCLEKKMLPLSKLLLGILHSSKTLYEYAQKRGGQSRIPQNLTSDWLADRLGTTAEEINKSIAELEFLGYLNGWIKEEESEVSTFAQDGGDNDNFF